MKRINVIILISIAVVGLILYALTLKGVSGNPQGTDIRGNLDQATKPFELSPERGRYLLTYSLAEHGAFGLEGDLATAAEPDVGYHEGKAYIYFAPGISVIALPFYILGKTYGIAQAASFYSVALFAVGTIMLLYVIARHVFGLPHWAGIASGLIFAFGSSSWSYAVTLYQHHVTTFCIISAFYAVWRYRQQGKLSWLWGTYVWLAYGIAIFLDYPNIILMVPVMLYFFLSSISLSKVKKALQISWRVSFLATSVVFIAMTVLHGYYNAVHFGNPLRLSGSLPGYKDIEVTEDITSAESEAEIAAVANQKSVTNFFQEEAAPRGFTILTVAIDKGILIFSPIFILALLGIRARMNTWKIEDTVLIGLAITTLFLYSSWGDPWGGWAFGPRYLIPVMALLSLFIASWLAQARYQLLAKGITFLLFIYSAAVALLGVLTTNQIPPKVEADYLGMKYNFLLNYDYLLQGKSSSFIYNLFFNEYMPLAQYYFILLGVIILGMFAVLFIFPRFDRHEH